MKSRLVLTLTLLPWLADSGFAGTVFLFNDGLHHVVDASNSGPYDGFHIKDGPLGAPTSVTVATGAYLGDQSYGGAIAFEHSILTVTGGTLVSDSPLVAYDDSRVTIYGGTVGGLGTVISLIAHERSIVDILGGTFLGGGVFSYGSSIVNVFGGNHNSASRGMWVSGLEGNATINVYGTGFNYAPGGITDLSGTLQCTLADGTAYSNTFWREDGGTINLIAVPESSPALLTVAGLAVLGGWRRRRRGGSSRSCRN